MQILNTVSNGMKRYANKRYIIPLLIILVIILVLMDQGPFGTAKLKEMSGGLGTLDMQFGYSAAHTYGLFEKIGSSGRLLYDKLLGLDFLFAFFYMILQSLLITVLMKKAKLSVRWEKLNLLPILRSALDMVENCLLIFLIASFPEQHTVVVFIASFITIVKLSINYGYIALVFFLGVLTTRQSVNAKIEKQKLCNTGKAV